jgi:hypothetical protein
VAAGAAEIVATAAIAVTAATAGNLSRRSGLKRPC